MKYKDVYYSKVYDNGETNAIEMCKDSIELSFKLKKMGHDLMVDVSQHVEWLGLRFFMGGWINGEHEEADLKALVNFGDEASYDKFKGDILGLLLEKSTVGYGYSRETKTGGVMKYTVRLADGTVGTIESDTLNGHHANDFIGEVVTVQLYDENGNNISATGRLVEVCEESEY